MKYITVVRCTVCGVKIDKFHHDGDTRCNGSIYAPFFDYCEECMEDKELQYRLEKINHLPISVFTYEDLYGKKG